LRGLSFYISIGVIVNKRLHHAITEEIESNKTVKKY